MKKEFAVKQYNWLGQVIGYQQAGTWIPASVDTYASREIEERIQNGYCELREPEILLVNEVLDIIGNLRGYLWDGMFIPNDENNKLFQLIRKYILLGDCQVNPEQKNQLFGGKKITEFIVGVYFDSQWNSIKDEVSATIDYEFGRPNAFSYTVRFKNLYCHQSPSIEEVIMGDRYSNFTLFPHENGVPRGAILEITLPVDKLYKIFRIFRKKMRKANIDITFMQDELDMHLAQTGREKSKGPTLDWLIMHLQEYVDDFILDIGNRALDYISYQGYVYEDQDIKHISKRTISSRNYILRKYTDNTYELHKGAIFQNYRFYDMGNQGAILNGQRHENFVNEAGLPRAIEARYSGLPLKKVRTMIECGLTLEALCILNSYLEVAYKRALQRAFSSDQIKKEIDDLSHRKILDIVKAINKHTKDNKGKEYQSRSLKIYERRNDYLHALGLPEESVFMTNEARMGLESLMNPFIQTYESQQFLLYLDSYRVVPCIEKLICLELAKFK